MGTVYLNSPSSSSTISELRPRIQVPPSVKQIAPIIRKSSTSSSRQPAGKSSSHTNVSHQTSLRPPSSTEWPPPAVPPEAWATPQRPKARVIIAETQRHADEDEDDASEASYSRRMPAASHSDGNLCVRAKRMILMGGQGHGHEIPQCCVGFSVHDSPQACCAGPGYRSGDRKNKHRNSVSCSLI